MLHFVRNCLFRPDSPLHQSNSLEQLIAEPITNRESEWFPCMFHDLRSLQAAASKLQAKGVKLEVHQQKIDVLQVATENTFGAPAAASANAGGMHCRSPLEVAPRETVWL